MKRHQLRQLGGPGSGHHGHKGVPGRRGGSAPSKGGGAPKLKLTKGAIGGFIQWTSSRYNVYKKSEVVDRAYHILKGDQWDIHWGSDDAQGEVKPAEPLKGTPRIQQKQEWQIFETGAYVTGGMGGADYLVNGREGYIARGYARERGIDGFVEHERIEFAI